MTEFNSRIAAQRAILKTVNARSRQGEELLALSRRAIDRWSLSNGLDRDGELVGLLEMASGRLFFLANKSQDQVSDEYRSASEELSEIRLRIREQVEAE